MRIAIDAMGGDHAPDEIVRGALEVAPEVPDATLLLVGQKEKLERRDLPPNVKIIHASEVVAMDEDPARALRGKPDSSLRVSLGLIKRREADAMVSAGNTGAVVGGATVPVFGLGNLEGVKRPALAIPFPGDNGTCALVDAGATPTAKPLNLVQYAVMGALYVKYLRPGLRSPRVALLNIGEEARKGNDLLRETYSYLEKARFNFEFVGNVEPHKMFSGKTDVVVCDGFVGNLALKMVEGVKSAVLQEFSNGLASHPEVIEGVRRADAKFDYAEFGGALLLGVRGIIIKAHGRSRARAINSAIRLASGFIHDRLNEHIVGELRQVSETWSAWFAKWFSWSKETE
jgi:glycerol-3-phosphate acyltransferase PlsX